MRVIVILLALLFAGCLSSAPPEVQEASEPIKQTQKAIEPLDFNNCVESIGVFPIPIEDAGTIPDGFSYVPMDPLGRTVEGLLVRYDCDEASEAHFIHTVTPPAEYENDEANFYMYLLGSYSTNDEHVAWYEDRGMEISKAVDTWTTAAYGQVARTYNFQLQMEDWQFTLTTSTANSVEIDEEFGIAFFGEDELGAIRVIDKPGLAQEGVAHFAGTETFGLLAIPSDSGFQGVGVHKYGPDYGFVLEEYSLTGAENGA